MHLLCSGSAPMTCILGAGPVLAGSLREFWKQLLLRPQTHLSPGALVWWRVAPPHFPTPSAPAWPLPLPGAAGEALFQHLMGYRQTSADLAEGRERAALE